jgi:biotin transport system substrate-specific component
MKRNTLSPVFTALFAALICAGSLIAIPVGPVPIVLQNAFAVLAGLLLGPIAGAGAVALFLLAGALGLPVFSGGRGGLAVLAGPTGGYLAGYLIAAFVAGLIAAPVRSAPRKKALPVIACATLAAFVSIYIPGILVLKHALALSTGEAIAKGFIPFVAGDFIKILVLIPISLKLGPIVARYLGSHGGTSGGEKA